MQLCAFKHRNSPFELFFNTLHRDRYESSGGKSTTRGGGLLTYIHSDLYLITERRVPNVDMEYIYNI